METTGSIMSRKSCCERQQGNVSQRTTACDDDGITTLPNYDRVPCMLTMIPFTDTAAQTFNVYATTRKHLIVSRPLTPIDD